MMSIAKPEYKLTPEQYLANEEIAKVLRLEL